ncbi:aldehyde dehydrogenase [Ornithinibacillus salinisoli]|uniref:Aldehyde dehydrogenase n=1 Tax=Ornithinibacillus salinisoli TaxID=1848459 RepID=A0ABW4W3X1_9BACI
MLEIDNLVELQRSYFYSGQTLKYDFRIKQLKELKHMLQKYEKSVYRALKKDLNKSSYEALTTEIGFPHMEIDFTIKHLKEWMKPEKVDTPITHKGSKSLIQKEPYGVTLVIAPWNYPLQLSLAPTIGAIAAGNTVIVKPSEYTSETSAILAKMIKETFSPSFITVVEGDADVSNKLLEQKIDYIFFTGSTPVGKIIMEKASKNLTPVTLELGGKSPVIVDKDANIHLAAKRIVWGKFTNAGQTCVAPDYVLVHEKVKSKLISSMIKQIKVLYGNKPLENNDYVKIVNEKHFNRLKEFLSNGKIISGGRINPEKLLIEPTIFDEVNWEDSIMQDEIFGPLLPILKFSDLHHIVEKLKRMEKPLALYFFGEKEKKQQYVFDNLSFGGGCINDTLYHLANPHLPFGGVGSSGIGAYHGKFSFDTFSHRKSILKQTTKFDIPFRYPGSKLSHSIVKKLMK